MGKRLGQHFLKNTDKIKEIIDSLDIGVGDTIIEIGPGRGALTTPLAERCRIKSTKIIAVEKDWALADELGRKLEDVEIISGDALKVLPSLEERLIKIGNYKIVGNIPYYITGHLLRILGELGTKPKTIVLMTQKEVALRICAKPPKMNLLSASVQFWSDPKILSLVPRKDFDPPPEVDSTLIGFQIHVGREPLHEKKYYKLVKILFKQPRKTVMNNLKAGLTSFKLAEKPKKDPVLELSKKIEMAGISPGSRPQNLSLTNIKKLALLLYN